MDGLNSKHSGSEAMESIESPTPFIFSFRSETETQRREMNYLKSLSNSNQTKLRLITPPTFPIGQLRKQSMLWTRAGQAALLVPASVVQKFPLNLHVPQPLASQTISYCLGILQFSFCLHDWAGSPLKAKSMPCSLLCPREPHLGPATLCILHKRLLNK
jgi:hypothetical protein